MDTIEKKENTTNTHEELGFKKLEVAEIVSRLSISLCSYQVYYHKLQNFHWNVVGTDFFDVHEITEELYKISQSDIDKVAERIRVLGETPPYKLSDYLRDSIVKESDHEQSAEFMFGEVVNDIQKLIETFLDVHGFAAKNGDIGTVNMVQGMVEKLELYHWQLSSWLNQKYSK